ncbi:uncharacterized protein LOC124113757 [Haliotis rufescens]|uniref:uncharacterized protein LOC124113757 n=1 Tax=Haliotis rufescens TaxID=6454 RepID=UPI001EB0910C|nr:uncharacterized protein LOC124113757 [Haliotis rufescens]
MLSFLLLHSRYSASIVTCSVGNVSNPRTVTLRIQKRNTTLTVFYPSREKVQFTICFPAVHSNYKNREELVQAISMNRILGAERFVLYNHSMSSTLHGVINVFVQNQVLEVVQWKLPVSEIHYVAQLAAVHDCFYKNRYTSKYIIFQDLDEFIIPKQFLGWDRMMSKLKRDYPLAGTFIFRHTFFPRYWPDAFLNTSDDKDIQDHKLYLLTKISRHARIMGWNERSKFIVVPSRVRIIGIHHVPGHEPGFRDVLVNQSIGLLHHYRASAPDSAHRVNDTSVRRFTSQLVAMTGSVWNCTGMT